MNTTQLEQKIIGLQDNMRNFAMSLTANWEDAEDLLQDTTIKVLNNREKFVDNVNFKGWVLTIMRNIFINNYHKMVRRQTLIDSDADLYNLDIESDSGLDTPEGSYQLYEINMAIEKLPLELRAPFSLYLSGYKYQEIADRLNVPIGTVKSRIFHSRKELQVMLEDLRIN